MFLEQKTLQILDECQRAMYQQQPIGYQQQEEFGAQAQQEFDTVRCQLQESVTQEAHAKDSEVQIYAHLRHVENSANEHFTQISDQQQQWRSKLHLEEREAVTANSELHSMSVRLQASDNRVQELHQQMILERENFSIDTSGMEL